MLTDDSGENPFSAGFSTTSKIKAAEPQISGLKTTATLPSSPSLEVPADDKYDDWFKPASADISTDFGMAPFATASSLKGLGKASLIKPSEASLAKAKAQLAAWEMEDSILESKANSKTASSHSKENRLVSTTLPIAPDTLFSTPTSAAGPSGMKTASLFPARLSVFKSPLQTRPSSTVSNVPGSPLNPIFTTSFASGNRHPLSGTPITAAHFTQNTNVNITPSRFSTPVRSNTASRTRPAKFITPFKPKTRPGELALPPSGNSSSFTPQKDICAAAAHHSTAVRARSRKQVFSLSECLSSFFFLHANRYRAAPPPGRKKLATSGLRPQQHDVEDYHSFEMCVTPSSAHFFFHHESYYSVI